MQYIKYCHAIYSYNNFKDESILKMNQSKF